MTSLMTEQEAKQKMDALVKEAYINLASATDIADQYGFNISWDLAYGMGGYYHAKPLSKEDALKLIESGAELTEFQKETIKSANEREAVGGSWVESASWGDDGEGGWKSSSSNC